MACCGQQRKETGNYFNGQSSSSGSNLNFASAGRIYYQYTGRTSLRVIGPVSGKLYQFTVPGSKLSIDPRDAVSFRNIPNLIEAKA